MRTRTLTKPTPKRASPAKPAKPSATKTRKAVVPAEPEIAGSKQSRLITLLHSPAGCTISDMMHLTGWQPHTVRGVISGVLRKKLGLTVQCAFGSDMSTRVYRIVDMAAA